MTVPATFIVRQCIDRMLRSWRLQRGLRPAWISGADQRNLVVTDGTLQVL